MGNPDPSCQAGQSHVLPGKGVEQTESRLALLGSESLSKSRAVTNHSALPTKNTKERVESWLAVGRK